MKDFYKKIEPHLRNELSAQEQQDFNNALANNKDMAEDLETYKKARRAISSSLTNDQEAQRLQTTLDQLNKKYFSKNQTPLEETKEKEGKIIPLQSKWFRLALAVASIVLLLFTANVFFKAEKINGTQLAEQFYAPKKTPATLGSNENELLEDAYQSYKVKNFPEAIRGFSAISLGHDRYTEAQLFLGYSYFESKAFEKAIPFFEFVVKSKDSRYRENAEWHKLLALLAMENNTSKTQEALKDILEDKGHAYFGDAEVLQQKLAF